MKESKGIKRIRVALAALAASAVMGVTAAAAPSFVYADTFTTNVTKAREGNTFVEIEGTFSTAEKQKILNRLNEIRLEACKNGYPNYDIYTGEPDPSNPLTMDDYHELTWSKTLETLTRIRAVELTLVADHIRPNSLGELYDNIKYNGRCYSARENASWQPTLMSAIEAWYAEKDAWLGKASGDYGHYMQMIRPNNKYVGAATFTNPTATSSSYYLKTATSMLFCQDQRENTVYLDKEKGAYVLQDPYVMPESDNMQEGITGKHTQIVEVANDKLISVGIKGDIKDNALEVNTTAQLSLEAKMKMTASGYGVGGVITESTGIIREGVNWSSSNTSVLKVDKSGKITALKEGTAKITAEAAGKKATLSITVKPEHIPLTKVRMLKPTFRFFVGETVALSPVFEPENASNKNVTWSTNKPAVATVDKNGVVTGHKKGSAVITATSEDGGLKANALIIIDEKVTEAESIKLNKSLLVLDKGKGGKLTETVLPEDTTDKTVTWSSSNAKVATVDQKGNVKAVNHGKAIITAKTANGKTAKCEVMVNFIDVTNPKDWYYKPVYWASEKGITSGTDGKFFPTDNCTREQAITFLWRMAGNPNPKNMTSRFSDVKDSKRYSYKAIMWGNENGIITGTDGKFYPTGTCTREQIVTMLWRLAGKPEPKNMNSKFKDVTSKTRYSYKAVMWAQENGITTGTNGLFSPTGLCKRREIVTFIYRYKN